MSQEARDQEFVAAVKAGATWSEIAEAIGTNLRNCMARRRRVERRLTASLSPGKARVHQHQTIPERYLWNLPEGQVVVFSDAHYWPGEPTTAHRALLRFLEINGHKVAGVVNNGDSVDGAKISRHPPHGWSDLPTVREELDVNRERLGEIEARCKGELLWTLGNHCQRFEARMASQIPEYTDIEELTLGYHFPAWQFCVSIHLNDDTVIKHRYKGGIHATHNNTIWAGRSMITGHLHSLKVTPFTDFNGTRFGVDTGTLADPFGPQFRYAEDGPRNWRSGFVVCTIHDHQLVNAEPVRVMEPGRVVFRDKVFEL